MDFVAFILLVFVSMVNHTVPDELRPGEEPERNGM
jgi:hypothetical protein